MGSAQYDIGIIHVRDFQSFKWAVDVENPTFFFLWIVFLRHLCLFSQFEQEIVHDLFVELCQVTSLILVEVKKQFLNYRSLND